MVALDGLRAVALLIIMGFHFGVGWLKGGFFSLDIFYVLSGYLITGLLIGEFRKRRRIKLSAFWLRRARRLLPALLIVLVAVTLLVRFVAAPGTYPGYRMDALSALFYFSNWWQIAVNGNYFNQTGAVSPLTHTWSLSLEEQFYLVWPLVVLVVMAACSTFRRGVRVLLLLSAVGAVASAIEMALLYHPGHDTTRLYFGTDTHAQSILIGACVACVLTLVQLRRGGEGMAPEAASPWARTALVVCGLAGCRRDVRALHPAHRQHALRLPRRVRRLGPRRGSGHRGRDLRAEGADRPGAGHPATGPARDHLLWRVSLALPGLHLRRPRPDPYHRAGPARDPLRDDRGPRRGQLPPGGAAGDVRDLLALGAIDHPGARPDGGHGCGGRRPARWCRPPPPHASPRPCPPPSTRRWPGHGAFSTHPIRFYLVGDSLAVTMGIGLEVDSVQRYGVKLIDKAVLGCDLDDLPTISTTNGAVDDPESACQTWPTLWAHQMAIFHPEVTGLLMGRWDILDHVYQGHLVNITQPAWYKHNEDEIEHAVDVLSAGGAHVMLFTMPYIDPINESIDGTLSPEDSPVRVQDFNRILTQVAARHPGVVTVVDLNRILDPHGQFQADDRRDHRAMGRRHPHLQARRRVAAADPPPARRRQRPHVPGDTEPGLSGEPPFSPASAGAAGTRWRRAAPVPTTRPGPPRSRPQLRGPEEPFRARSGTARSLRSR